MEKHARRRLRNTDFAMLPLLVLCFSVSLGSMLKKCSSVDKCICSKLKDQTWAANCSNLSLSSFPKFQENVSVLYISNNDILQGRGSPQLPSNLRELHMSGNKILYNDSPDVTFLKPLKQLEILDISDNLDSKRNTGYPSNNFRYLQKLKALYIDGLWRGDFNEKDWNLTSLTNLTVSGKTGKCYFEWLHSGFFSGLTKLKFLTITGCWSLHSIDKGVFCHLRFLHTLDLSFNEYLKFAPLQNVSFDLQFTKVEVLLAKKLHCTFGIGTYLFRRDFVYFRNTSIRELDLSSNRIEQMDSDVPKYLPSKLEILNVSYNRFIWGMYMLSYPFLENLRIADVSRQYFYKLDRGDMFSCVNTLRCEALSSDLVNDFNPKQRIGKDNVLSKKEIITFYAPPKLEKLFFHSSHFKFSIGEVHFGHNHIKEYHVQSNFIYRLDGPMYGMESAQFVDISGNFIKQISPNFFNTFPNISHLNISNNLLGSCLSDVVQEDHFQTLTNLVEIRLSNNGIATLPRKFLSNARSLRRLDLSHNLIHDFIFTLNNRNALQYLDLSCNRLLKMYPETIQRLENTHKRNNLTVDISGNLFDCTCDTIFFLKWIRNSKINFVNKQAYLCRISHNQRRTFIDLDSILGDLEHKCSSNLPRTLGMTVSVMIILVGGIACVLYKYRWPIRYFFYLTKWEMEGIFGRTKFQHQRNYEYSALIAYSEKDLNFVKTELVHQLEELNGITLFVPHRDVSPNVRTYANTIRAIHSSRKIICIITEDFMDDYWCMYQLQMAEEERIHREEQDCIVFILLKSLSSQHLRGRSLFLVSRIEQSSYALFPENEADRSTFWRKLIDTVQ